MLVTESGILTADDVKLCVIDIHGFLVGEAFMRQADPGQAMARCSHDIRDFGCTDRRLVVIAGLSWLPIAT